MAQRGGPLQSRIPEVDVELTDAYEACAAITRDQARNFSVGIRLLPRDKRQAMSALYAYARRVDDVGDGAAPVEEKRRRLDALRDDVLALDAAARPGEARAEDPVWVALRDARERFPLLTSELLEVIEGCEMDCVTCAYERFEDLERYCTKVAGSIGRLSLAIFGDVDHARAHGLANTLGLALQVTNILRDVVEDRDVMGRVYLPREDLARFGCGPDVSGAPEHLADLIRFEAGRARALYGEGLQLLELLDHRSRACVGAMSGIYLRLLDRIDGDPLSVLERRVSLPSWQKAWVAARCLAGVGA